MTTSIQHRSIWGHLTRLKFRQDWIDTGLARVRYAQSGPSDAPTLIMIHGTGSSWECFCATLESHAVHFNCLAIDLPGSGFSDKPDEPYDIGFYVRHVLAFMEAMNIPSASFIGVSLGAWILSRLVVDHPEKVEKLILLAPSGLIINPETLNRTKRVRTLAVDDPSWENIAPVFDSILHKPEDRIKDLIQLRQTIYMQIEMKMAMDNILVLQDEDVRRDNLISEDQWRQVKVPILIILAPDDKKDYFETGLRIAELAQDVQTLTISDVKHWAHFEAPGEFNPASVRFLLG